MVGNVNFNGGSMGKVLVACEESQAVTIEMRKLGVEAYSCDVELRSGGYPEWHLQRDVGPILDDGWDMIVAFPPCTHLAVSGAKHFEAKREDNRQREAIEFFMRIYNARCRRIAIENPVGILSGNYIKKHFPDLCEKYNLPIKPSQYIQPWQFGHSVTKKTGFWLKNLPKLMPTNVVEKGNKVMLSSGVVTNEWYNNTFKLNKKDRGKIRSKTFRGIAEAIARQWGPYACK